MTTIKLIAELNTSGAGTVRTVVSAERKIIEQATSLRWYGPEHPSAGEWADDIEACILAIAATTGEQAADLLGRLDARIDRSFARQTRESEQMARSLRLI